MIPRYLTPKFLIKKGGNLDWRRRGDHSRDLGRWLEAAEAYGRHLEKHPADTAIWIQYGHMLKEAGRLGDAIASYNRSEELDPGDKERDAHLFNLRERMATTTWTPGIPIEEEDGHPSPTARPLFVIPEYVVAGPDVADALLIAERLRNRP